MTGPPHRSIADRVDPVVLDLGGDPSGRPDRRRQAKGPSRAAQFGIIPTYSAGGRCEAQAVRAPRIFASPTSLSSELAATSRLDIGVDASPGPADGWSRIVEDMIEHAKALSYAERLPRSSDAQPGGSSGGGLGRFSLIVATTGPVGMVD